MTNTMKYWGQLEKKINTLITYQKSMKLISVIFKVDLIMRQK